MVGSLDGGTKNYLRNVQLGKGHCKRRDGTVQMEAASVPKEAMVEARLGGGFVCQAREAIGEKPMGLMCRWHLQPSGQG